MWLGALLFIIIVGAVLMLVGRIFALLGYNRLRVEPAATNQAFPHTYHRAATAENFKSQQKQ